VKYRNVTIDDRIHELNVTNDHLAIVLEAEM
jgi:hypothetical protein